MIFTNRAALPGWNWDALTNALALARDLNHGVLRWARDASPDRRWEI
jgi:hypothetical protein